MTSIESRDRPISGEGPAPVTEVRVKKRDQLKEAVRSLGERVAKFLGINLKERQIAQIHKNRDQVIHNQEIRKQKVKEHKEEDGSSLHLRPKKRVLNSPEDEKLRRGFEALATLRTPSREPLPKEILDELEEEKSVADKMVEVISDPIGSAQQVAQAVRQKLPTSKDILKSTENLCDAVEGFVENPQDTLQKVSAYVESELPSPDQILKRVENGVLSAVPVFLTPEDIEANLAKASGGLALQEARTANYAAMTKEEKDSLSMKDRGMLTEATQAALQAKEAERLRNLDGYWTHDRIRFQNTAFARGAEFAPHVQARRGELIQRILTKSSLYTLEELKAMELEELETVLKGCESVDKALERVVDVIETAGNALQQELSQWIGGDPQEAELREEEKREIPPTAPMRTHRPVAPVQTAEGPSVPRRRRAPHEEKKHG